MDNLALKINGQWAVLGSNCKISIDRTSPLWNESGTFSYPFPLPYLPNRHIFGILDLPESDRLSENIKYQFELYSEGILLLQGVLLVDEEPVDDSIGVHLTSGRSSFNDMIEGLKCTDIPLKDKVGIGGAYTKFTFNYYVTKLPGSGSPGTVTGQMSGFKPSSFMSLITNVDEPYPAKRYCNANVISSDGKVGNYDRNNSGICFYLLYFLDCLFFHLGIRLDNNPLMEIEDFRRLAFFTTKCEYIVSTDDYTGSIPDIKDMADIPGTNADKYSKSKNVTQFKGFASWLYATNKNFPEDEVSKIIDLLSNTFGIKLILSEDNSSLKFIFIRDILKDNTINNLSTKIIKQEAIVSPFEGVILTYDQDDDSSFFYDDYSNVKIVSDFDAICKESDLSNTTCYISSKTGNAYRYKVDKKTFDKPSLFEVGQFNPIKNIPNKLNKEPLKITLGFLPVISNVIPKKDGATQDGNSKTAVYIDKEVGEETSLIVTPDRVGQFFYFYPCEYITLSRKFIDWSKINDSTQGITLGIMRGSGSDEKYAILENVEVNLGDKPYTRLSGSCTSFVSDSIDSNGAEYDYNGNYPGAGNDDLNKRFSLKIKATKKDYSSSVRPNRGLADQFLSEYLYFLEHRKTLNIIMEISLADLINIDWTKKYKIGEYTGYFNKTSFDISSDSGLSLVEAEFFMI